jgi:alpha-ketoglutarate-dependent taurine dioxygenase
MIGTINQFIHDPINQHRVKLKENELLIIDNCQVLHGRTAFSENEDRLLLRLWNESWTA